MLRYFLYSLAFIALITGCSKDGKLEASKKDDNLMSVKDNPADPTDHAIYQFFQSTGIPCFYNDTIAREQVSENRYNYTKLSLAYSPVSGLDTLLKFQLPEDKTTIIPMLDFLKTELLPLLPPGVPIRSILFVDTLTIRPTIVIPDGPETVSLNAFGGFNTVAIKIVNPDTFTVASKRMYIAGILDALFFKKLTNSTTLNLSTSFYSISRLAFGEEIYITDFTWTYPDLSKRPEDFGLIFYYPIYEFIITPSEQEDLHAYLLALFSNTTAEFTGKYAAYPVTLQKFGVVKKMVKDFGFQFAD